MTASDTSKPAGSARALRWRIVVVLLVAALLPLMISGFGSWIVFRNMLQRKSLELMTNVSDLLQESTTNPEWLSQALEAIERSREQVRRCAGITRKMLQFGRKRESDLGPVDITQSCAATVELLRRHAAVRNIKRETDISSDLPPVLADHIELEQMLVNLINNAVDAMPDGGAVNVSASRDGKEVHLQVSDNGIGVAQADIDRIFEPFYTTKPPNKGTGLGLSVCYGMVQSWGRRIRAQSEQGRGTVLHIHLPTHGANGG